MLKSHVEETEPHVLHKQSRSDVPCTVYPGTFTGHKHNCMLPEAIRYPSHAELEWNAESCIQRPSPSKSLKAPGEVLWPWTKTSKKPRMGSPKRSRTSISAPPEEDNRAAQSSGSCHRDEAVIVIQD